MNFSRYLTLSQVINIFVEINQAILYFHKSLQPCKALVDSGPIVYGFHQLGNSVTLSVSKLEAIIELFL
jgi:hypothetical protein